MTGRPMANCSIQSGYVDEKNPCREFDFHRDRWHWQHRKCKRNTFNRKYDIDKLAHFVTQCFFSFVLNWLPYLYSQGLQNVFCYTRYSSVTARLYIPSNFTSLFVGAHAGRLMFRNILYRKSSVKFHVYRESFLLHFKSLTGWIKAFAKLKCC